MRKLATMRAALSDPALLRDALPGPSWHAWRVLLIALMAFVHWWEEPTMTKRFGQEYEAYCKQVPGWWPRVDRRAP